MDNLRKPLLAQIKYAVRLYDQFEERPFFHSYGVSEEETQQLATAFIVAAEAAIQHATGSESVYSHQATRYIEYTSTHPYFPSGYTSVEPGVRANLAKLRGVLQVVEQAIEQGYLASTQELVRAEVFSDFLDMAQYLQESGYKDPAAVIAGSVLEQHLRKLCLKHNLPIEAIDSTGKAHPKKAESLNADLAASKVYGKNDQKQVTAWLDLRNSAAHGHYDDYTAEKVVLFIQGVRHFLALHPA